MDAQNRNDRLTVRIDRYERDSLHKALRMEIGSAADSIDCHLDRREMGEAQRYRERFDLCTALLDSLGWALEDGREHFEVDPHKLLTFVERERTELNEVIRDEAESHRRTLAGLDGYGYDGMTYDESVELSSRQLDAELENLAICTRLVERVASAR